MNAKQEYQNFLNTDYWRSISAQVKARAGHRCQICNSPDQLETHHRVYMKRGTEHLRMGDLTCVCRGCHQRHHFPKMDREQPTTSQGVAKAKPCTLLDLVLITHANAHLVKDQKEMYHWMVNEGIDPTRAGWRKRMVGRMVPPHFLLNAPERRGSPIGKPWASWGQTGKRGHRSRGIHK